MWEDEADYLKERINEQEKDIKKLVMLIDALLDCLHLEAKSDLWGGWIVKSIGDDNVGR